MLVVTCGELHACRSAIPVVTAVLAVAIEKKVPTRTESFALLVLVSGVMVAVWEGAAGSLTGILICVAGNKIITW